MGIFGNAFKIPYENTPLNEEEIKFLDKVCLKIKEKKMSEVALFLAESTVPFHNLTSQMIVFGLPFLNFLFKKEDLEKLINVLQKPAALKFFRENLEKLTDGH